MYSKKAGMLGYVSMLMGIVALGLVGYGIFSLVKAKYQKTEVLRLLPNLVNSPF